MTISATILDQLGGNRFVAMTGAKNFVASVDALSFQLPGTMTRNRANVCRIAYDAGLDAYFVTFMRRRGVHFPTVGQFNNVQAAALRELFTRETGLDVHL
jgi:hypothetical protein